MDKVLTIAFKDLKQSFRSMFAIMFMFVVPILMTGMFSLMFGGSANEQDSYSLPTTDVIIVNQDKGTFSNLSSAATMSSTTSDSEISSVGETLTRILESDELKDLVKVKTMTELARARDAVDNRKAGLVVIIPEGTTENFMAHEDPVPIKMYQDPTLTIGPSIVHGIIRQELDHISSSKITMEVTLSQLETLGIAINNQTVQSILTKYFLALQETNQGTDYGAFTAAFQIVSPIEQDKNSDQQINAIALIMMGMTVFYVFFTGSSGAQNVLREEDKGTLPRLFSTPTPIPVIFLGKFVAIVLMILIQIVVLFLFGHLVFDIYWGSLAPVAIAASGTLVTAAGFGIFLISLVKTERQAGILIGSLVTIMGMMGMMPIYIMGIPNPPAFINLISHLVPQGWAVDALQEAMIGGTVHDIIGSTLVLLGYGIAFLGIGIIRFRKRYI